MPPNLPCCGATHIVWCLGAGQGSQLTFASHLKGHQGPKVRCLHQACKWIHSQCMRLLEGHWSKGLSPIYGRGAKTEVVLQLKDWCHRLETWWSCPSQGRCLSREEEDHGQIRGQVSWSSSSDLNRHPFIWSERPAWKFMHSTLQLAPPHCIRSWHSLECGCPPGMGWMYQSLPSQAYSQRGWQHD